MKEAHGIVVTDVAFVPESRRGRELLAGNEAALLSVAVDSRCKLHLLPSRRGCWVPAAPLPLLQCVGGGSRDHSPRPHPSLLCRLSPHLAAATALRWAHRGHHPAAAACLPGLPVGSQCQDGPPRYPGWPASAHPKQTVKQTRDQPPPRCPRWCSGSRRGAPAQQDCAGCGAGLAAGRGVPTTPPAPLLPLKPESEGSAVPSVPGGAGVAPELLPAGDAASGPSRPAH